MIIKHQIMITKSYAYVDPIPWAFMRACFLYMRGFITENETSRLNDLFFSQDEEMHGLAEIAVYDHWLRWMNRVEPQKLLIYK